MEVYETVKLIGSGAFGQVYLVKHKREDKLYVNKKIKTRDMNQKDRENTENEVRLLQKLRHANIVSYKDSYMDREQFLNIVMIHCEGGDMHNKIKNQKGKNFPEDQILDWLAQMALALFYLHEKKILHRDLKTQNIFLKHGRVRLGDFGIAKVLDSTRDFANTCIGTPYYMSPELFKYKPYSYKSDVWAFGCVLYEMCNLRHAFDAENLSGLAVKIMKGSYPPINSTYSKGLRGLIGKMLQLNPKSRPSILDIINVSFVKRRIISYVTDILSGNYPEANLINDVDDVYFESLQEQAQKLGLLKQINSNIQRPGPPVPIVEDQPRPPKRVGSRTPALDKATIEKQNREKKELLRQISEKNRLEEEIKRLEKKKIARSASTNIKTTSQQQQNQSQQQSSQSQSVQEGRSNLRKGGDGDRRERGERSYSFERENSVNRKKPLSNQQLAPGPSSKSSVNSIRNEVRKARQFTDSSSTASTSAESEFGGVQPRSKAQSTGRQSYDYIQNNVGEQPTVKKDIIRQEQEKKRKQDQEDLELKRKQIQQENQQNRQKAMQMKQAQYRPSKDNALAGGEEEEKISQQQQYSQGTGLSKRGSMQSLESKKQVNAVQDDFSLDLIERESFDQKMSSIDYNNNSNLYNSEKYASIPAATSNNNNTEEKIATPKKERGQIKIQEDFAMDEEQDDEDDEEAHPVIFEEENEESGGEEEEDQGKIEEKLELMKTKLKEKTIKINTIKESLNLSKKMATMQRTSMELPDNEDAEKISEAGEEEEDNVYYEVEDGDGDDAFAGNYNNENDDNYQEEEGEEQKEEQFVVNNPQYFKIQDKIKLFRHRCEASLGTVIFDKAYDYLKANASKTSSEEQRKVLSQILSEENIGFWHLIDQVIFLEELSQTIPRSISK